jgi:hypothetical protein
MRFQAFSHFSETVTGRTLTATTALTMGPNAAAGVVLWSWHLHVSHLSRQQGSDAPTILPIINGQGHAWFRSADFTSIIVDIVGTGCARWGHIAQLVAAGGMPTRLATAHRIGKTVAPPIW